MKLNYYQVLGVEAEASQDEIKKAFRKKAIQFHPDMPNGENAKFQILNEAYQIVGDPKKRKEYNSKNGFGRSRVKTQKSEPRTERTSEKWSASPANNKGEKVVLPTGRRHCTVCGGFKRIKNPHISRWYDDCEHCRRTGLEPTGTKMI